MSYARYKTWVDGTGQAADAAFLNGVEDALVSLFGVTPATNGALVWDGSEFTAANKIVNANVDASAAIARSKLNFGSGLVNADIAAAAAIAYSKLNLASSVTSSDIVDGTIVNGDISASAAIGISKLASYPTDATKFLRGDGTWAVPATAAGVPSGSITQYGAASAPTGWVLCDGTSYLRSGDAAGMDALYAVIGTTYGSADGTHFYVPDFRGRVPAGYAASGGHTDVSTLANNDGAALANRRPKHNHDLANKSASSGGGSVSLSGSQDAANQSFPSSPVTANTPKDAPSYLVVNYIIKK